MNAETRELYDYLRTQFSNLSEAKEFYSSWVENDQDIKGHPEWSGDNCCSMRAMAGHISCALTGGEYDGNYVRTKHGSEIYLGM